MSIQSFPSVAGSDAGGGCACVAVLSAMFVGLRPAMLGKFFGAFRVTPIPPLINTPPLTLTAPH